MSVAAETGGGAAQAEALARWLDGEPADELLTEVSELRARVDEFAVLELPTAARLLLVDGMVRRIADSGERLRAQLLTSTVPLPRALYSAAIRFQALALEFARLCARWLLPRRDPNEEAALAASALGVLRTAYLLAGLSAASVPEQLWQLSHRCGALVGGAEYASMLALAAAQPESLSARELSWLADLLLAEAAGVAIADGVPPAGAWWFDAARDMVPVEAARETADAAVQPRHFTLERVLARVADRIAELEARIVEAAALGRLASCASFDSMGEELPPGLTPTEMLAVLRRLSARWTTVPVREHRRQRRQYAVQVCVGLGALWELGRGGAERGQVFDWRVLNEDPGGYAIMSVAGAVAGLTAGVAIGLRRDPGEPWALCVVRWVRSDNPDQIELGLQTLSPSFRCAQVVFEGAEPRVLAPALELPALPPIRPRAAFLVPAGTYVARSFVFMREGEALYLAHGRALGVDMQTSALELFQYENDPYSG